MSLMEGDGNDALLLNATWYERSQKMNPAWKCKECGYTLEAPAPPEECPSCRKKCEFLDVTCYIPECGDKKTDERIR
jgi:rubredoxin